MSHPTAADRKATLPTIDALELLDVARAVAAEAGALAADMRSTGISVQSTKSNQLDIVTQADTAVEALIRERLTSARPVDGFLGEETGETAGASGITWIVDPIDGTVNYLYGSPYYAVSIAATVQEGNGRRTSLAGCVHAPALSVTYTAAIGHPARLDDRPVLVNAKVPLEKALVSTGIPYDLAQRARVLETIAALTPRIRDLRLVGAASLEICGVAEGRTDAHFQRGLPAWDYAAAALIAAQAGADVRGASGGPPGNELLLIADRQLADELDPLLV
ncbi:inositol monophosphatase family protein [Pseudonocardia sp. MH-G8]|uniref:inositol monophosphatase family protein n=1 Tax=Pseudonocardia sp. MH-G8 TaxID=1854588 RepID=UPI000BA108BB|nr:inositol monophosphatase family protein [Pseudonocardia sp. MH-G8]OZM77842.1 inositol monophosphatase [Pseudonocardia sp. MH-G8]